MKLPTSTATATTTPAPTINPLVKDLLDNTGPVGLDNKMMILSGPFGCGKSVTSVSYMPPSWFLKPLTPGKVLPSPRRIVIDNELRLMTYKSLDDTDHPEKKLYRFDIVNGAKRMTSDLMYYLMYRAHTNNWGEKGKPVVVVIDDAALLQDILQTGWSNLDEVKKVAALYGKQKDRCITANEWKPKEPGTISFFKSLLREWMLDLRENDIALIVTSPLHNMWENYGMKGTDPVTKKPYMKIKGKSAHVWDVWQQMADVIWNLSRDTNNVNNEMPSVSMDPFIHKAALPGVKEQFKWEGWAKMWHSHLNREFVADLSRIAIPEAQFDQDSIDSAIKAGKRKLITELRNVATMAQIGAILHEEFAPEYTLEPGSHEECKDFIVQWIAEHPAPVDVAQPAHVATDSAEPEFNPNEDQNTPDDVSE